MKKEKLTKWYPAHINPVRVGIYHAWWNVDCNENNIHYAYWDGKVWGWMMLSKELALSEYTQVQHHRHKKLCWRGLAEKP